MINLLVRHVPDERKLSWVSIGPVIRDPECTTAFIAGYVRRFLQARMMQGRLSNNVSKGLGHANPVS
jgi:hypothetical protein